jgi:MarR family transcriptional regulator for hemolysin
MKPDNLERSVGLLIHDISRMLRRRFEHHLKSDGLTRSQWSVLVHLARHEGINQISLAEILEIEPISLVRILDRLEAAGWVERRPDPNDRRARLLYLKPEADAALEPIWRLGAQVREEALLGILPAEREHLVENLLKMKANLSGLDSFSCRKKTNAAGSAGESVKSAVPKSIPEKEQ